MQVTEGTFGPFGMDFCLLLPSQKRSADQCSVLRKAQNVELTWTGAQANEAWISQSLYTDSRMKLFRWNKQRCRMTVFMNRS